jgi:Tfp pilus assembly PilM family ATPase
MLLEISKEAKSMVNEYELKHGNENSIKQIVTLGSGANMPGLASYLTNSIRLPVRNIHPWHYLSFKHLQPPSNSDKPMYSTAAGLSMATEKEAFSFFD